MTENSNASGSDETTNLEPSESVQLNKMVLLVQIAHVDSRPIEPEILTEATFKELCQYTNPDHEPYAVRSGCSTEGKFSTEDNGS